MMSYLWIFLLASLAIGANAEDLNLEDAVEDATTAPPAVPDEPVAADPVPEVPAEPEVPAADPTTAPEKPEEDPAPPPPVPADPAGDGFDLLDALSPDKPTEKPKDDAKGGFSDSDLMGHGDYKPDDSGKARAADPASNGEAADEPKEAGGGQIAGIIAGVGAAIVGAVTSFIAYQKKKLCFKIQGGDPESANKESGVQSDPQVMSNLLNSS
ncbi:hypothetical protein SKAU_G00258880 [Synaphobranchus kaupii]|uniref:CD99 antigen n=1 Tax=Synaphobranchus kaupii TaxID=118154 RepID=A0A9Q1F4A6_SYNKA|nr:hypothetical protein SKAU_G00258880 [Synaphobranchus kaupii]